MPTEHCHASAATDVTVTGMRLWTVNHGRSIRNRKPAW
ncbi:hypothetical protein SXCC_04281 [Gluconacetobacter sp. SXCC-1]|nr:hypothetical protein SXCC_04281 [Gluconacetobacter sp. SXCC-1]